MSRMMSRMPGLKRAALMAITVALASGAWLATARAAKKDAPVWSVDLEKHFRLQTFDRPISRAGLASRA